jgi:hypothetical protein
MYTVLFIVFFNFALPYFLIISFVNFFIIFISNYFRIAAVFFLFLAYRETEMAKKNHLLKILFQNILKQMLFILNFLWFFCLDLYAIFLPIFLGGYYSILNFSQYYIK